MIKNTYHQEDSHCRNSAWHYYGMDDYGRQIGKTEFICYGTAYGYQRVTRVIKSTEMELSGDPANSKNLFSNPNNFSF